MNREDINFNERSCIVFGKGDKEREVYFDARTKLHLQTYLKMRTDDNPALFVSLKAPYTRLTICGVEKAVRKLGTLANIEKEIAKSEMNDLLDERIADLQEEQRLVLQL